MSADIRLAESLEQILRSELMKRLFDVFDAVKETNQVQISQNHGQEKSHS